MAKKTKNRKTHGPDQILHTANNLLAGISLTAEVLIKEIDGTLTAKQRAHLKGIVKDVKKIKALADTLANGFSQKSVLR